LPQLSGACEMLIGGVRIGREYARNGGRHEKKYGCTEAPPHCPRLSRNRRAEFL
jgi:hypothetical protein